MPFLPTEILTHIFQYATHIDGFAFGSEAFQEDPQRWVISSLARRSIPLVSRRWHSIGWQLIYEHIVLQTSGQASRLNQLLAPTDSGDRVPQIMRRIAAVEIVPNTSVLCKERGVSYDDYIEDCTQLLIRIPQGHLITLSIDLLPLYGGEQILYLALPRHSSSLKNLRISRDHAHAQWTGTPFDKLQPNSLPLPVLRTLHLASGRGSSHPSFSASVTMRLLCEIVPSLETLQTLRFDNLDDSGYGEDSLFFRHASNLTSVHIGSAALLTVLDRLDIFLPQVPNLRYLILTVPAVAFDNLMLTERLSDIVHHNLESITAIIQHSYSWHAFALIWPLFNLLGKDGLPSMRSIRLVGNYPDGCIDSNQVLPPRIRDIWKMAITLCSVKQVAFINEKDEALHLWEERHSVKPLLAEGDDGDAPESDEGDWFEEDTEADGPGSDDATISDDSQDRAYTYQHRHDLDSYNIDWEKDQWSDQE
ncbi:SubName: Full=Uncharacterized protein {ECO:0000313/EMBL:CCA71354.1} [Serendipita indica DSM 11827]|nr:SubName: Full=Uncharacterized protein {ECO:0000313/EMBL:CCA71354.1} [Serendipita indica DSM 11827]